MLTLLLSLLLAFLPAVSEETGVPAPDFSSYLTVLDQAFDAYEASDAESAVRLCESILPQIRATRDEENLCECLSLLGASYHRLGIFDLALDATQECYQLDLKSGDAGRISSSLNNLAGIYLATGEYETAESMILDAIEYEKDQENSQALAIRYGMAADIYQKLGRYDLAVQYATTALNLDREAGRTEKVAIRLSQLAEAYLGFGKLGEAERCLNQAVPVFLSAGNDHSLAICRQQQGMLALKRNDRPAAIRYFRMAADLARKTGNRMVERNVQRELAEALRPSDPTAALASMERYMVLNDSILKQETTQRLSEFRIKYELAEKDAELTAEKERLRTQKRMTFLFLALTILLLAILVGTWYLHQLRLRNRQIQEKAVRLKGRMVELGQVGDSMSQKERKQELENITKEMSDLMPDLHLTPREIEVAKYSAEGLLSKEIGDKLGISQRTVETHKTNIFRKLGINTTVELVRLVSDHHEMFRS